MTFGTPLHRLKQAWDGRGRNKNVAVLAGDVCDVSSKFPEMRKLPPGKTVLLPVADLQGLFPAEKQPAPVKSTKAPATKTKPKSESATAE
jgi:hypothetical protein